VTDDFAGQLVVLEVVVLLNLAIVSGTFRLRIDVMPFVQVVLSQAGGIISMRVCLTFPPVVAAEF
jgi:hypothetical protein